MLQNQLEIATGKNEKDNSKNKDEKKNKLIFLYIGWHSVIYSNLYNDKLVKGQSIPLLVLSLR